MVVPVRVLSMGQIDLFENYLYYIGILETIWMQTNDYYEIKLLMFNSNSWNYVKPYNCLQNISVW